MRVKDGAALKRKRINRNYTQRDLAFLVKRTQGTIWALETGKQKTCTEDLGLLIAARLDVDWEDYFELEEREINREVTNENMRTASSRKGAVA